VAPQGRRCRGGRGHTVDLVDPATPPVEDAIALAAHAHRGQRYPSPETEPYILHPLRVMLAFVDPVDQMVAVLHDTIEDTSLQLDDLADAGYPAEVVRAIDSLTHRAHESYEDYIDRLATNGIARRVKIADLGENLANNLRLPPSLDNAERIARYRRALARLGAAVEHASPPTPQWAERWQRSWDRLEENYIPDRELRLRALLDVVEAMAHPRWMVLDLACGTGTITRRLLERIPEANSIALDVDPVLLTIANATFTHDERVRIVAADLRDTDWLEALPEQQVDAVITSTALHWLSEDVVRRLYRDLSGLVRPGGVFAHLEKMPLVGLPRLGGGLAEVTRKRRDRDAHTNRTDWDSWWDEVARDPALRSAVAARRAVFDTNYPTDEFSPPADWHIEALHDAGFAEAGVVWRSGSAAVVAAVR
jgi:SAM-dependent methyltransferase